jgi:aerobic carbon-monoxide dehydrogenase large subunit
MNAPVTEFPEFSIGKPVRRSEDPALIQGRGRYSDDIAAAGQAFGVVVRSRHAHGLIRGVDLAAAKAAPGVLAIYTAADLAAYHPQKSPFPLKSVDGTPMRGNGTMHMARDKVRYVGDPIALVVAENEILAREAAELVEVDIEPLPAVTDARAACAPDAPQIYEDAPANIVVDHALGDRAKVAEAFAKAKHVARLNLVNNRVVVAAMEPRAALFEYDAATERFTAHMQTQGVFGMRNNLAAAMGVPNDKVRVLTAQVGGSFGMKGSVFPEYIALLHAARDLKRPIKWSEMRSESFVSDHQGRDHDIDVELALDEQGHFLALRMNGYGNLGAYVTPFGVLIAAINIHRNAQSVYRTPLIETNIRCVVTNTPPIGAYRGAGRPEGNYVMERMVEEAARVSGIDSIELRRRNHIRPEELPFSTGVGSIYDSGDFPGLLDAALDAADWNGFEARKAESAKRGKLRGRGVAQYLEITAPPTNELGEIRFEDDGGVTIVTGTLDFGQGHATTFAQVLVEKLGVPFDRIRLVQGDSDQVSIGGGTGGSKSTMASGAAIIEASDKVIEAGKIAAAHLLETAVADIEFSHGAFSVAGTDRRIGVIELAQRLRTATSLPTDCPHTLNVSHVHKSSPSAYPNGCHVAEVEVDPETGVTQVVRYTMTNDFGTVVNPMIVEGQAHGGVIQGIGQAFLERVHFDSEGQLLTGSFTDYAMPRAGEAPPFAIHSRPTRATSNPLGAKGCGEAGCAGALPSVMNALVDALKSRGVAHVNMPATPEVVWRLANGRA